eukprot:990741-Prorocentrum_minimum.AAC.1
MLYNRLLVADRTNRYPHEPWKPSFDDYEHLSMNKNIQERPLSKISNRTTSACFVQVAARANVGVPQALPEHHRLERDAPQVRVGDEHPVDVAATHRLVKRDLRLRGGLGRLKHRLHLPDQLLALAEELLRPLHHHHVMRELPFDERVSPAGGDVAAQVGLQRVRVPNEGEVEGVGTFGTAERVAEGSGEAKNLLEEDVGDGDGAIALHGGHLELVDAAHDGVRVGGDVLEVLVEEQPALARVGVEHLPRLGVRVGQQTGGHEAALRRRHHEHAHRHEVRLDLEHPARAHVGLGSGLLQDLLELQREHSAPPRVRPAGTAKLRRPRLSLRGSARSPHRRGCSRSSRPGATEHYPETMS